jgi:hypothetical protein
MNQSIELHDSELAVVWFDYGAAILIFSHAYVHRSAGEPGVDVGSGWSQRAELVIEEATQIDLPRAWPCKIYEGVLELNGVVYRNEIIVPLAEKGSVRLKLEIADHDGKFSSLEILGKGAHLTLLGEAHFVEQFKP